MTWWHMKKIFLGVLAVLGVALAGCVLPPRPIYRTQVASPPLRPALTTEDVLKLVRAGISEAVILQKLKSDGIAVAPSSDDLVALKKEGAGDRVIEAMLAARIGPPVAAEPLVVVYPYSSWNFFYDGPWWGYPYGFYPWGWHFGIRHHW